MFRFQTTKPCRSGRVFFVVVENQLSSVRLNASTFSAREASSKISSSTLRTACITVVWSRSNLRPISGSEREVSCLARYIAIWRGRATVRARREDCISLTEILKCSATFSEFHQWSYACHTNAACLSERPESCPV